MDIQFELETFALIVSNNFYIDHIWTMVIQFDLATFTLITFSNWYIYYIWF